MTITFQQDVFRKLYYLFYIEYTQNTILHPSGAGAFLIAVIMDGLESQFIFLVGALLLGFVAYGLSIYFYILAQRHLGAARTSAFYVQQLLSLILKRTT